MKIHHSLEEATGATGPAIVTIGSFDGIHIAHQKLLLRVRELARAEGASSVAITFDPHPVQILAPERAPKLLTPLPMKVELLRMSGIDRLLILPFTLEFSGWSPEQFVEKVLHRALSAKTVVVGDNFRFGHQQSGTPQVLRELGLRFDFQTEVLPSLSLRKVTVSSSKIRRLLNDGNVKLANRLLGRYFSVRSRIAAGLGIGRAKTVPTLNLGAYSGLLPGSGVYVTSTRLWTEPEAGMEDHTDQEPPLEAPESRQLRSVTNVGRRPTFGERELGVETHLLEPWDGTPPTHMEVSFLYRLRDERKFDSAQQLKSQILEDVRQAERYLWRLERFRVRVNQ